MIADDDALEIHLVDCWLEGWTQFQAPIPWALGGGYWEKIRVKDVIPLPPEVKDGKIRKCLKVEIHHRVYVGVSVFGLKIGPKAATNIVTIIGCTEWRECPTE